MDTVDVLVIGGGIAGVSIAQFAAASGFDVVLWEKNKIGSATSANSSKLIHGGLRYLESGQISLVKRCLHERKTLLKLAPQLVFPMPFYIPIYKGAQRSALAVSLGLGLYQLLSKFDTYGKFRRLSKANWNELDDLKQSNLKHVFQYWDAVTDDQLLTQAVADSAVKLGAKLTENINCKSIYQGAHIFHAQGKNQNHKEIECRAKMIINASGPWVNETLNKITPKQPNLAVDLVQGSHLLLDLLPPKGILYLESHLDKRAVFVIPWQGKVLLGTTETALAQLPSELSITQQEQDYLLAIFCRYFPKYNMKQLETKILRRFCGMRVLPKEESSVFYRSRETIIHQDMEQPNIISIYGGKLTEFRVTAKEVLNRIQQQLGSRVTKAEVEQLPLLKPQTQVL